VSAPLDIVVLGLSITSSWGNGHATTYRCLARALVERGHELLFLERDAPWYRANRDLPRPPWGRTELYRSLDELRDRFAAAVRNADLVVVGSYVPEGRAVVRWALGNAGGLTAFYDIDTPVTLAALEAGDCAYLEAGAIPRFDLYLSFTGGPTLGELERRWGARRARALYCSFDPKVYFPESVDKRWDLGYLGTYSADRQPGLDRLLTSPARRWGEGRFVVAGPQYPEALDWPPNVERHDHVAPAAHRRFYNAQRFTLNLTRAAMRRVGWSPSVRLFEAAACATPIISDRWPGLDELFEPEREILLAADGGDVLGTLRELPEPERLAIGRRARRRVLLEHRPERRVEALEGYVRAARRRSRVAPSAAGAQPRSRELA